VGAAQDIVFGGQIEARKCRVFEKNLVYFFAARPAYRMKTGEEKSDQINLFPFVFVVAPNNLGTPYHVYPFDTGGAASGVFHERADPYVPLEEYELEPTLDAVARHISWAFGDVDAYFLGEYKQTLRQSLPDWQDSCRSCLDIARLASAGSTNQPDRRASAIEVAYRDHVPLRGNVLLAILPKQYLEHGSTKNSDFMQALTDASVDWETYDWQPNSTPDEYHAVISRIVRKRFLEKSQ
jgi:hypothetical protein